MPVFLELVPSFTFIRAEIRQSSSHSVSQDRIPSLLTARLSTGTFGDYFPSLGVMIFNACGDRGSPMGITFYSLWESLSCFRPVSFPMPHVWWRQFPKCTEKKTGNLET